jgi:tRNA A-37 threonylcarbamoyl transferase component Bud32
MRTHKGNVGAIIADIGKITINTLEKFGIPYDELYFGKPYADFYIDDLAINPYYDMEKEIGIYNPVIEARSFNNVIIQNNKVIKTSVNDLSGEIYWYNNIPNSIKNLFPILYDCDKHRIEIEYINGIPLSLLYINNSLTCDLLKKLLKTLNDIHLSVPPVINFDIKDCYINKLMDRIQTYNYNIFKDNDNVKSYLIHSLQSYIDDKKYKIGVIHGDPVLTNIILVNNNDLKFIDMRGKIGNVLTIYGDIFYDYAKVYQSIIGYDYIINNKEINNSYTHELMECFHSYILENYDIDVLNNIRMIADSLLYTLIPLHNNEKCVRYFELIGRGMTHK